MIYIQGTRDIIIVLPKAKVFGRTPRFLLFGLWRWPPKFNSKRFGLGFCLKIILFLSLKREKHKEC